MSLQEMRLKAGLSQSQLSKASGVNLRMIQKYEQGARRIDGAGLDILCKLAIACKCEIIEILESNDLKALYQKSTEMQKAPE